MPKRVPHPLFKKIFVAKNGDIYIGNNVYPKLKRSETIKIDESIYYDFQFYKPIASFLNKELQKQISPIDEHIYKLSDNRYYNELNGRISNYVYESLKFGVDENNEIYDKETNAKISKYSRVYYHDLNLSKAKILYQLFNSEKLSKNEIVITFNPHLYTNKLRYSKRNLIKVDVNASSIVLSDGIYFQSSKFPELYISKNVSIFNTHTNFFSLHSSNSDFIQVRGINVLKAYLVYHTLANPLTIDKSNFNFINEFELVLSSGEIYNINDEINYDVLIIDETNIKKHPKYEYGIDLTNNKIYSYHLKKYINNANILKLWHNNKRIYISIIDFIKDCLGY